MMNHKHTMICFIMTIGSKEIKQGSISAEPVGFLEQNVKLKPQEVGA